jgi:uncharacterized protein YjlB
MPDPIEQLMLASSPQPGFPNNPALPVVVHHGVGEIVNDPAACERLFASHGWGGSWRNGIFPFHHFHSNAHEVLGIISGQTEVVLGGPGGASVGLAAGDVVILPAGTGHMRVGDEVGLLVVGAYPPGQEDFDLRRGDPDELSVVTANIDGVAMPPADPVAGPAGAVMECWSSTEIGWLGAAESIKDPGCDGPRRAGRGSRDAAG